MGWTEGEPPTTNEEFFQNARIEAAGKKLDSLLSFYNDGGADEVLLHSYYDTATKVSTEPDPDVAPPLEPEPRTQPQEPAPPSWRQTWWTAMRGDAKAHYTTFTRLDIKMIFMFALSAMMMMALSSDPMAMPNGVLIGQACGAAGIGVSTGWRYWSELRTYGRWQNDQYDSAKAVEWLLHGPQYADQARVWVRAQVKESRGGTHKAKKPRVAAAAVGAAADGAAGGAAGGVAGNPVPVATSP